MVCWIRVSQMSGTYLKFFPLVEIKLCGIVMGLRIIPYWFAVVSVVLCRMSVQYEIHHSVLRTVLPSSRSADTIYPAPLPVSYKQLGIIFITPSILLSLSSKTLISLWKWGYPLVVYLFSNALITLHVKSQEKRSITLNCYMCSFYTSSKRLWPRLLLNIKQTNSKNKAKQQYKNGLKGWSRIQTIYLYYLSVLQKEFFWLNCRISIIQIT